MLQIYKTRVGQLSGTNYTEVRLNAMVIFHQIKHSTKRRPYIRSVYFNKQKIFFDFFWQHLAQKNPRERFRRLKYFAAAIEVLRYSHYDPIIQDNRHVTQELLYRFSAVTKDGGLFCVQVKENLRSGNKYFMSCFPKN